MHAIQRLRRTGGGPHGRRPPRAAVALLVALVVATSPVTLGGVVHLAPTELRSSASAEGRAPALDRPFLPAAGPATNSSPPSWVNLSPSLSGGPAPRADASMAYDEADQEFVLFGGYATTGAGCSPSSPCPLRDTWALKNHAWSNLTPAVLSATNSPSARWGAAATYDATDGYLLLFGGATSSFAALGPNPFLNDTWSFRGGAWSELCSTCAASGTPLAPRSDASLAFDRASGSAVMIGGIVVASPVATGLSNQSLKFAGGSWSLLSTPVTLTARSDAGLAFDNQTRSLVLFGGYGGAADTWSFTGSSWSRLTPAAAPSQRGGAALIADPLNGSVLLVGGCSASGCPAGPNGETWEFTGANWVNLTGQLVGSPSGRSLLTGASEPLGPALLLFGGLSTASLNDTFEWDQVEVSTPTVLPSPIDVGQSSTATTVASSPVEGLQYLWIGTQAGCFSANLSTDVCMPGGPGSFPVNVRVTDGAGLSVVSFAAQLAVNPHPTATAQAAPTAGTAPLQVTFSALTSGGTAPFTFAWVFGDGTIGVGSNPAHTYLGAGVFEVHLWANDSLAVSAQATLTVSTVAAFATQFIVLPSVVVLGGTVTFYANATGGHAPYTESFAGLPPGCLSRNASTVSCAPTAAGLYTVRATISDSAHLVQNDTSTVDVVLPIALVLTLSPASLVLGQVFAVNATVTGGTGVNTFHYFGLPSSCTGNNRSSFTCRSDLVGAFTVNATVTDSSGARAHDSATLTVLPVSTAPGGGGLSTLEIGGIVAIAVVAAVLGLLLYRRRRRGPPIVPPPHANLPPPADLYVPPARPKS